MLFEKLVFASLKQRNVSLSVYGGSSDSLERFRGLPGAVREVIEGMGFMAFIRLLVPTRADRRLLRALIERWWDTTNTFHLRFAEMTVTPLDFSAITGLRVGGEPVPFDSGLYRDSAAVRHFLGREIGDGESMVRCDHLPALWDHEPESPTEVAQMARAYLLYLFGVSLFPNRRSEVHLGWLPALADLSRVASLDFGGAALCTLYCFLGSVSRGVGTSLGGFWRVLEVKTLYVLLIAFNFPEILPCRLQLADNPFNHAGVGL